MGNLVCKKNTNSNPFISYLTLENIQNSQYLTDQKPVKFCFQNYTEYDQLNNGYVLAF